MEALKFHNTGAVDTMYKTVDFSSTSFIYSVDYEIKMDLCLLESVIESSKYCELFNYHHGEFSFETAYLACKCYLKGFGKVTAT